MGKIISFLFITIIPLLPTLISAVVTRVAISLGFGTVTYMGFDALFETIMTKLKSTFNGIPSATLEIIGLIGIHESLNLTLSAGFALLMFKGMNKMGQARSMVWRKPGSKDPIDWGDK